MKKTAFILLIFFAFYYKSFAAAAMIKSEIDINLNMIKGSITIASTKAETVTVSLYNDMQLLADDKRVKYNKNKNEYVISLDGLSPVILSYIKNITNEYDTISSDFISIYSSIVPAVSNIENAELYINIPENFQGLASQFVTYSKNKNTMLFTYNHLPKSIYFAASSN